MRYNAAISMRRFRPSEFFQQKTKIKDQSQAPPIPFRFLIHGWRGDMDSVFNEQATIEFLIKDNINVVRVDWSEGAQTINYFTAANRVPEIGRQLGRFIDFLHFNNAIDFGNVTIIGFSLGGLWRIFPLKSFHVY
jgi:hypothetical protein